MELPSMGSRSRECWRYVRPVRPIRFYIPNLPSFLNEDEVQDIINDENTAYVKQKQNRKFGITVGGFYVGIKKAARVDRFLNFEGKSFKMVCMDKPRNVVSYDAPSISPELPNTNKTPEVPNTNAPEAPITNTPTPNKEAPNEGTTSNVQQNH